MSRTISLTGDALTEWLLHNGTECADWGIFVNSEHDTLGGVLKDGIGYLVRNKPELISLQSETAVYYIVDRNRALDVSMDDAERPTVTVTTPVNITAVVGETISTQLVGSLSNNQPATFTSVDLPPWLSVSSSGLLTGSADTTVAGSYSVSVTGSGVLTAGTITVNLTINSAPVITVDTPVTLDGYVGEELTLQLEASVSDGGTPTYSATSLPAWLTLSTTGELSGTPTDAIDTENIVIDVTYDNAVSKTIEVILTVLAKPVITVTPLVAIDGMVGKTGTWQITASVDNGGTPTFTPVDMPNWLTLGSNGSLTGTPVDVVTDVTFTVTVSYPHAEDKTVTATINVVAKPVITATSPVTIEGYVDDPISVQLVASATEGKTVSFTATNLPEGVTCSNTGLISGTPTSVATGTYTVIVSAEDADNATIEVTITTSARPEITVTTPESIEAFVGDTVSKQLTASVTGGGEVTFIATLPAGLSCSSSGLISGTPTESVTATDYEITVSSPNAVSKKIVVNISIQKPVISVTSPVEISTMVGKSVSQQLVASVTGNNDVTFSATSLPHGLTCSSTGLISGVPTTAGSSTEYNIDVTSPNADATTIMVIITIAAKPVITTDTAVNLEGIQGKAFSHQLTGTATGNRPVTYVATSLPDGWTCSSTGLISGTCNTVINAQDYTITASCEDADDVVITATISVAAPTITATTPVEITATVNEAIDIQLVATSDSDLPITFTSTDLPEGLTCSTDGKITGTVATAGTTNSTVNVTTGSATSTITVNITITEVTP